MHGAACISFIRCGMYVIINSAITIKSAAQKEEKMEIKEFAEKVCRYIPGCLQIRAFFREHRTNPTWHLSQGRVERAHRHEFLPVIREGKRQDMLLPDWKGTKQKTAWGYTIYWISGFGHLFLLRLSWRYNRGWYNPHTQFAHDTLEYMYCRTIRAGEAQYPEALSVDMLFSDGSP